MTQVVVHKPQSTVSARLDRAAWTLLYAHSALFLLCITSIIALLLLTLVCLYSFKENDFAGTLAALLWFSPLCLTLVHLCACPLALTIAVSKQYRPSIAVAAYPLKFIALCFVMSLVCCVLPYQESAVFAISIGLCYFGWAACFAFANSTTALREIGTKLKQPVIIQLGCHGTKHDTTPPPIGEAVL